MSDDLSKYLDNYLSEKYAKPCVAMLTGKNCRPCDEMKPKFEKLSKENPNFKFLTIDASLINNFRLVSKIGFSIEGVPAFATYVKGKCIAHFTGADEKHLNYLITSLKSEKEQCRV